MNFNFTFVFIDYPVCLDETSKFWYRGKENYLFCYDRFENEYKEFELNKEYFNFSTYNESWDFDFNDIIIDSKSDLWIAIDNGI